jgi:hypothetical protein
VSRMPPSVIILYLLGALPTLGLSVVALVVHCLYLVVTEKRLE